LSQTQLEKGSLEVSLLSLRKPTKVSSRLFTLYTRNTYRTDTLVEVFLKYKEGFSLNCEIIA